MRLIDADALMDEIKNRCIMPDWCKTLVRSVVLSLPTIEPKKGKWIKITDHEHPIVCKCTECGWLTTHYDSYLFCPNCGALNER